MAEFSKPDSVRCIGGTGFYDYVLVASVDELISMFGEPTFHYECPWEKSQYYWILLCKDGEKDIPFTIYDWKEFRPFGNAEIIMWHLGTRNEEESEVVSRLLKENYTFRNVGKM